MNANIINQFKLLIKQIKFDIDFTSGNTQMINMYRLKSIQTVLDILEKISYKITSENQLKDIKGIGERSLKRIREILKTGKLSEIKISEDIDKYLNIISELEDVYGIGRKKAYELFKKHNVESIADLQNKFNKGEIDLPSNIVKGLKYIDILKENIPRYEMDMYREILMDTTIEIDPQLFGMICGSYRRGSNTSNDIDFIMVHTKNSDKINYIEKFVLILKKKGIIVESLTTENVPTKYMGICKLDNFPHRRIDIRFVKYESFYSAILYFTGSRDFNKKMRHVALGMGYTLNEYGLYDNNGIMFDVESEKDIFDKLGMEYINPDKR